MGVAYISQLTRFLKKQYAHYILYVNSIKLWQDYDIIKNNIDKLSHNLLNTLYIKHLKLYKYLFILKTQ